MNEGERPPLDDEVYDDHLANAAWEGMPVDADAPIAWWMSARARDLRTPVGSRVRRRGIDVMADHPRARSDWLPIGPRNIAGRTKAIAVTPGRPNVLYAGTASGGLYRTTDRGLTWTRLWTAEVSLSIGAIAVAQGPTADTDRVMVGTGEPRKITGVGVLVSNQSGAAGSWTAGTPSPPAINGGYEAIAIDPANSNHAWAVGAGGAHRSTDGGVTWTNVDPDVSWSDVHFHPSGALLLARGGPFTDGGVIDGRAIVVRLTSPTTATAADLTAPVNVSSMLRVPANAGAWPARVKFAIAPSLPTRIYARVADTQERHMGVFRTNAATGPMAAFAWQRLADAPDFHTERQGILNLCIVVHPTDANTFATAMVLVHVSRNGGAADPAAVTYERAMSWQLHDQDRTHHADNHQLLAIDDELWVANDGGVSMCANWRVGTRVGGSLPLSHTSFVWESRDDGISASQFYDVSHSPLLPGVVAGGFQDNGTHMSASGQSWRNVHGGDGGFTMFDPDDPFTMLVTTQNGIARLNFPSHTDRIVPGEQPSGPLADARPLGIGFERYDRPLFVAETVRHPGDRSRVLHAREGRLYGSRRASGETWRVESLGRCLDLRLERDAVVRPQLRATIAETPGAHRLGFVPGPRVVATHDDPLGGDLPPAPNTLAFVSHLTAPYRLVDGDELRLEVEGDPNTHVIRFAAAAVRDITAVTLDEVVATINRAGVPGLTALPRLWPGSEAVELISRSTGSGASIAISGSALDTTDVGTTVLHGVSRLGLNAGTYRGGGHVPASITLGLQGWSSDEQLASRQFPPANRTLNISIDGGPVRTVTLAPPAIADPNWITADELAAAIRSQLAGDAVDVVAGDRRKRVIVRAHEGRTVSITGTAADRLGIRPIPADAISLGGDPFRYRELGRHRRNGYSYYPSFDLAPTGAAPPLQFTISDGTNTATVVFDGATMGNLRTVTVEELAIAIDAAIAAAAPSLAAGVEFVSYPVAGEVSEMAWSQVRPDRVWAGQRDGLVSRSDDGGITWTELGAGVLDRADARVEAIALHPSDPDIAYLGHFTPTNLPTHHALVHRTADGGSTWVPRGIEANGHEISVNALELHPDDPTIVFAATDHGVFWSTDEGANWSAFSDGLPHCRVVDLATDATGPHLIAATWGAGAFRRYVGVEPPDDVRLHLRTTELDDGDDRARFAPNPFSISAHPTRPQSPDIKVTRPGLAGPTHDGVRFDLDVATELPVRGQPVEVLVQVHNRGSQPARSGPAPAPQQVRLVLLGVELAGAPPPLPVDFWTDFRSGAALGALGRWVVLSDSVLPTPVTAETPQIVRTVVPSATLPLASARLGVLALVTGTDDVLSDGHLDVDKLVRSERRAAYGEFDVLRGDEDATLVLRSTLGHQLTLVPTAPPDATAALRLPAGPAAVLVAAAPPVGTVTYDLSAANPFITIREDIPTVTITYDNGDREFRRLDAVRPSEIAVYSARRLRRAGLPMFTTTTPTRLVLRALGDATVEVTGGSATGGARYVFAPAGPQPETSSAMPTVVVGDGRVIDIAVRAHGTTHTASLRADAPRTWLIAAQLNRGLADAGLDGLVVADERVSWLVAGDDENDHVVRFDLAATAADLAHLHLDPAGHHGVRWVERTFPVSNLAVATAPRLDVTVQRDITVRLRRDQGVDATATAVSPAFVRRTINHMMEMIDMGVRAEPAVVRLKLGASTTDRGPSAAVVGTADLADIATSGASPAPVPADLFDPRRALSTDRLQAGPNHVYVRCRNDGNVTTTTCRWRLFRITVADPVVTAHVPPVVLGAALEIPAHSVGIGDISYTPTAAAGSPEVVLAVVDDGIAAAQIAVPASWPTLAEFLTWVDAHPSASVRRFDVSA